MNKLPLTEFVRLIEQDSLVSTLTKRELFAAMAMMGSLANPDIDVNFTSEVASDSVLAADALIRELNK